MEYTITQITSSSHLQQHLESLRALLQSCVNLDPSTSSIGFLAPLSDEDADDYWLSCGSAIDSQPTPCHLFVVTAPANGPNEQSTEVLATVQLQTIPKATHSHRAEVAKLLVLPSARRLGIARKLAAHVEAFAKDDLGKQILTLSTKSDTPARVFYNTIGWTEWGTCPDYAAFADGRLGNATFFVKHLQ
ncbi:acyl-CoA N-acyltransferase [Mariannaea sp. PMI_226]|nr:acyl-CoA N-acyltransferase [Mariannaea sp. PMI_226]